ncbi:MAG: hypothetical protein DA405_12155 [Bacteroidetes bacterium]|nr:MAG: hypothetical protein DA405_12155 [Bacteroidota bacterium]
MNISRSFSIKGVGKYFPKKKVLNSDIEEKLNLPEGYILKNIGVQSRRQVTTESNTFMGQQALRSALNDANLNLEEIDCLIGASATFDYVLPNRSCLIKESFPEAKKIDFPCIDINTVCTSFITALDYASLLLTDPKYQNIAIVSSEISSHGLNSKEPESYALFGDGAAAIIISKGKSTGGLLHYTAKTYSEAAQYTIIQGGGNANHPKHFPYDEGLYSFKMMGHKLLKAAKRTLPFFIEDFFKESDIPLRDVNLIVPHQASKLGLRMLASLNQGNTDNIVDELSTSGNCIAASIPLALVSSIKNGRLNEGDSCFLIGTAAGMTISGLLFKYSKK